MNDLKRLLVITRYTFSEIYKSRILLSVIFLGAALIAVSYVASEFTFGVPQRVAIDFGIGLMSISGQGIAIFMGVSLIAKELESRTIYMALSRPLPRWIFILGRVLGLSLILAVNLIILWILSISTFFYLGGSWNVLLLWALIFSIFEALLVLMIVVCFSLIANTVRAILFSLATIVAGYTLMDPSIVPFAKGNPFFEVVLKLYRYIFPDFTKLNIKPYILYDQLLPESFLLKSSMYGVIYIAILSIISVMIFRKKELN